MSYPVISLFLATGLLVLVAGWDIARRRIPNWANAALGACGIAAQAVHHGGLSALGGVAAGLLMLVLLWSPWSKGRLGGGDVKAAVCAATWVGLALLPHLLLVAALVGGVLALVSFVASSRAARQEVRDNLRLLALRALPDVPIRGGGGRVSVPLGAAFAAATAFLLWVK